MFSMYCSKLNVWTKIRNKAQVTSKLDYAICEYDIFQRWVQPAGFSNPGWLVTSVKKQK